MTVLIQILQSNKEFGDSPSYSGSMLAVTWVATSREAPQTITGIGADIAAANMCVIASRLGFF